MGHLFLTHISPEDPDATFSPNSNKLKSISSYPSLDCRVKIEVWVELDLYPYKYSEKPVQNVSIFPSTVDSVTYQTI